MRSKPSVTIIGAGAVGAAWLDFFKEDGYSIISVWKSESGVLTDPVTGDQVNIDSNLPDRNEQVGDWVIITTPDDLIETTAGILAESEIDWTGRQVAHCSGSFSASALQPLSKRGAGTAAIHPIQTFNPGDNRTRLQQIYLSLQGDPEFVKRLESVVEDLGSEALLLDEKQKMAVHIAAVFASNYLVALLHTSDQILKTHGVEDGVNVLAPLIEQTLKNILELGPGDSLTGPIARGDSSTVQAHLDALKNRASEGKPDTSSLYRSLGAVCLDLAAKKGDLTDKQIREIKDLLS